MALSMLAASSVGLALNAAATRSAPSRPAIAEASWASERFFQSVDDVQTLEMRFLTEREAEYSDASVMETLAEARASYYGSNVEPIFLDDADQVYYDNDSEIGCYSLSADARQ